MFIYSRQRTKYVKQTKMTDSKKCIFDSILEKCSEGDKPFSNKPLSEERKCAIIKSSKERGDNFGASLVNIHSDELQYHPICYLSYNERSKIEKYVNAKRKLEQSSSTPLTASASKGLRSRY